MGRTTGSSTKCPGHNLCIQPSLLNFAADSEIFVLATLVLFVYVYEQGEVGLRFMSSSFFFFFKQKYIFPA